MHQFDLKNRAAIITGGAQGFGLDIAKRFLNSGAKVIIWDIDEDELKKATKEIDNSNLSYNVVDVSNFKNVKETVDKITKFSNIDILINNAGTLLNKPFTDTTFEDFKQVYTTNVFGVAELTRRMIPFMPKKGHVVTISSMGGVQGSVKFPGLSAYSSSKGAVITLTELLAEEYKESGPSFNVLALGAVQTEMLAEAFPGYEAPTTATEMANYIFEFAKNSQQFYNGKLLQISNSTP